jgi:hypothetical protein
MKEKFIIFFMLLLPLLVLGQEKINNLKAPTSPASSILGVQPTSVLSPKSYQALEAAIYSNFITENSLVIPNDFSLEFTPYWATNRGLSLSDYLFPKRAIDQLVRNFSFSIATTQKFFLGDSASTNSIAFGYRTTFYLGNEKDRETIDNFQAKTVEIKTVQSIVALEAEKLGENIKEVNSPIKDKKGFLKEMKKITLKAIFSVTQNIEIATKLSEKIIDDCKTLRELDVNDPEKFIDDFLAIVDIILEGDVVFNTYKTYINERQGFAIDIAYANFINFPTNNFEFSILPTQSFWVTPTYRFKDKLDFLVLMGVLRYEWYDLDYYKKYFPSNQIYENNFDYGLAISAGLNKLSFQFEVVGRKSNSEIPAGTDSNGNNLFTKEQQSDLQYIGSLNYNISDQIILTYNLGNRFEPIQNPNNTLVSSLTLNFGFGSPTKNNLNLEK